MRRLSSANARSGRSKIGSKIGSRIGSIGKIGKRRQRPTLHRDQENRSEATENSDKASKDSDIFENAADTKSDNHQQLPSSSSSSSSSSSTSSGISQVVLDGTGTADTVAELVPPSAPITDSAGQGKESSAEKMAPILADDVGVVTLAVSCGENEAELRLNDLRGGSRRPCVQFGGAWMTPNEFQSVSGRGNAKDWKRSIRHHGRPLKFLMERGLLSMTPPFCLCQFCESQGSENRCGVGDSAAADVKPIKRTKISSTAKEDSQTIGRRRRKYTTAIDLNPEETQTRRKTRKTKQNEAIDRNIQHNQYGRRRRRGRRAGDSGKPKTPASTRRRRCTSKTASNGRTGNFEKLLKGTEKSGRLKRGDVEGERVEPHEKALELCDDDSRTIIDGGELFAAAVAAATAATDGESPSGSGAVDAGREENPKSFEISVAEDGVALCETERPRKRGRKRKAAPMIQAAIDETKRADEKRVKIEDGSDEFFAEPESRKADDKKVPELNKSLREDDAELNGRSCLDKDEKRNAEIEIAKSVDKKLNENHPDRNRTMKLWHKEISDDKPDERPTDTKSITGLYDSEEFRNPLNDQSDEREDRFSSLLLQSTPFASQNKHIDSKQSQNGRLFTPSRQSSGTSCSSSSSSRGGRRSRRGTGRGSGGRACVTSKMADSTTLFDARSHVTMMTSSSEPIESASDDVSRFGRPGDVTLAGVKTRNKKMDRIRPGNDVTKTKSLSLSPVKFPEAAENRFNEFPAGSFPETLFRNSLSANVDDDVRFRAMTSSSLLPVCSLRYLRDLYSGLDLVPPPPPPPPGHNPLETGRQRRRSRGSRQRRNGVVSSTTFDVPMTSSYDPTMTSLYDPTMTSLYVQQTSSMTPFQQHDPYRPSPGGFLFYAQGAPLGRRPQPMDFYYGRGVEGGASLAVGRGVTPAPGGSTDARFVYDECGALDLTVPKIRSA